MTTGLFIDNNEDHPVARPLKILIPLIKEDLERGEQAGMEFYRAAGEKLIEAREGNFKGSLTAFYNWAENTFGKKRDAIRTYMALAAVGGDKPFKSLRNFKRETGRSSPEIKNAVHRPWTQPVDAIADRARDEARRLALQESLTRQQEREADRKLALRLIDIGYKVLARELHPDKGGSREAMARLNRVRNNLKESV